MSYQRNSVERWPLLSAEQRAQKAAAEQQERENLAVCERIMTQLLLPAPIATLSNQESSTPAPEVVAAPQTPIEPQTEVLYTPPPTSQLSQVFLAKAEYVAPDEDAGEVSAVTEPKEKLTLLLQKKGFTAVQIIQIFEALTSAEYAPPKTTVKKSEAGAGKAKKKDKVVVTSTVPVGTEVQFPQNNFVTKVTAAPIKPCTADAISTTKARIPAVTEYFNDRDKKNGVVKIPVKVVAPKEVAAPTVVETPKFTPVAGINEVADVYLFLAKGAIAEAATGYAYLVQQDPSIKQEKLNKLILAQQAASELKVQLKDYPGVLNVSVAQRDQKFVVEVAVRYDAELKGLPVSHNNVLVRIRMKQTIEEYQKQK